ncbi:MAG: site-specific integrase [Proteobacteria bacterium]|nr:site-specific integrase [Pseudomonadota bacterium]
MGDNQALVRIETSGDLARLADLDAKAAGYAHQAKAENTKRAYRAAWTDFTRWCAGKGLVSLPALPRTVGWYLSDRASTLKTSTLQLRLSAISQAHRLAGCPLDTKDPAIKEVWSGIKRANGTAQDAKAPVMIEDLRAMVEVLPDSLLGVRDRALLVLGFAGAFRRSELVGLDVGDIEITNDGLVVTVRRSKTDQEAEGTVKGIPYGSHPETCPVRAVQAWLEASGIEDGALFRSITRHGRMNDRMSDKAVALVVKRTAEAAGLDPARFSGHSLRAGFATSAAARGVNTFSIMDQTGHKRTDTLKKYVRMGNLFRNNAAAQVGL